MTPRSSTRVSKQSARAIEADESSSLTRKRATSGSNSTSNAPTKKNKKSASKGSKKASLKASKDTENPDATNQAAADALLGLSTQQSVVEEDQLSFSSGRDEVDDDAVLLTQQPESQPKPEPEPEAVKFTFSYKAVNGKEKLPGSFTAVRDTETFFIMELERLQRRVVEKTYPREWLVLKLEATASYEKMRASDTQTSEVESGPDLEELMGLIRLWRSNWPNRALTLDFVLHVEEIEDSRSDSEPEPELQQQSGRSKTLRKSATQQQLASTAEKLAAEEAAGNFVHVITDRWICENSHCKNKGHVCWQNKQSITAADIVVNHYPCSAEILRRWNSEIKKGFASVEVPSQNIIVQMVTWKEALGRKRQQIEASVTPTVASQASVDSGASSQINQLLQVLLVSQIRQMAPPEAPPPAPLFPPQKTQLSHAPPPNSSPISSDTDPVKLLAEFFEWLKLQPGFNTQQQVNILEETKVKMVEEQWSLDSLKPRKPDEGISQITWEEYGFKIGLLVRIRAKISDFKRLR